MIDSQKNIVTCIQEHAGLPGASGRLGKARCWCRQPGCAEELGEVEIAFLGRGGVVWGADPESRYHVDVDCEEFKYAPVPALSAAQLQQSLNWPSLEASPSTPSLRHGSMLSMKRCHSHWRMHVLSLPQSLKFNASSMNV